MGDFLKLGMADWSTALAYWANIGITIFCVIYGIKHWNHSDEPDNQAKAEVKK